MRRRDGGVPAAAGGVRAAIASTLLALLVVVAGCASTGPRPPDEVPPIAGRMAVRVAAAADAPARSLSAGFELGGDARDGRLVLSTPIGTLLARARWSPAGVVLATPEGESDYADLGSMSRQLLGEELPLGALFDWLRGRPWPGAPSAAFDGGAPGFAQLGWRVDLARFADGVVVAMRDAPPAMTLQVKLDRDPASSP